MHTNRSHVPYTTRTGLQIGADWEPPVRNTITRDMELVQVALLQHGALVRRQTRWRDRRYWIAAALAVCAAVKYLSP